MLMAVPQTTGKQFRPAPRFNFAEERQYEPPFLFFFSKINRPHQTKPKETTIRFAEIFHPESPSSDRATYWLIYNQCTQALDFEYNVGHSRFVDLFRDHRAWILDKAFFWLFWAKFEELFSEYDVAADLLEQAVINDAQV